MISNRPISYKKLNYSFSSNVSRIFDFSSTPCISTWLKNMFRVAKFLANATANPNEWTHFTMFCCYNNYSHSLNIESISAGGGSYSQNSRKSSWISQSAMSCSLCRWCRLKYAGPNAHFWYICNCNGPRDKAEISHTNVYLTVIFCLLDSLQNIWNKIDLSFTGL